MGSTALAIPTLKETLIMNHSAKGKKVFVHVPPVSQRVYNVGERQRVAPINLNTLPKNVKSDVVRINHTTIKRVKGKDFIIT